MQSILGPKPVIRQRWRCSSQAAKNPSRWRQKIVQWLSTWNPTTVGLWEEFPGESLTMLWGVIAPFPGLVRGASRKPLSLICVSRNCGTQGTGDSWVRKLKVEVWGSRANKQCFCITMNLHSKIYMKMQSTRMAKNLWGKKNCWKTYIIWFQDIL